MIFENILVDDDKYTCIDYEWFFDFQIPDEFVKYRSIYYFYINNKKILSDKNISLDELCNCVNIAESNINTFAEMEENFQKWVVGDSNYTSRYECEVFYDSVAELKNKNDEFSSHLDRLNTEISTKDKRIVELQDEHEKDVSEMQKNWKKIDELNEEKNELLQKNEVCEYNLNKANSAIHDKDVHIINLESQINFLNQQISMKDNHIANLDENVDERTCPCFIWSTVTDEVVPVANSMSLANALMEKGVSCELHIFPMGLHGLSRATAETAPDRATDTYTVPYVARWIEWSFKWLEETLYNGKFQLKF